MFWRESLPARVALATAGLLAVVLVLVVSSSYVITAILLRRGVDEALLAALPVTTGSFEELVEAANEFEEDDDDEYQHLQVLDLSGRVRAGSANLPVDKGAVKEARKEGKAFTSLVWDDHRWHPRRGPDWLHALAPREHEVRVLYALVPDDDGKAIVQFAAPIGPVAKVLPSLLVPLLVLALLGVAASSIIAWRMAKETYRPLQAVIDTAGDITTETLSLRIPDVWQDRTLRRLVGVLNAMIARLQAAFEAQGRFVSAAAHELRGPLGAMRAELEVALRRERSLQEYREALDGALEETVRLSTLAESLLVLARYERGVGMAMERNLPLAPLLERAAADAQRNATGASPADPTPQVQVDTPPGLMLDGDPITLERAFSNLVSNGLKAGGAPVKITARDEQGGVRIQVWDRGSGIPPEALPHVFEPFYRADPARSRDGGTGLGLSIVKTVVDAHGGQITAASAPGQGTAFSLWLPRRQD